MKYLFVPILFLSFFLLVSNKNKYPKNTNVILKVSNLKEEDVEKNLINEFRRKSDIDYIDGSVLTKTVVLQVNERKFNKSDIQKYMQRWGLDIDEYVFVNNTSIYDIEN